MTLAQRAQALLQEGRSGCLSTHSAKLAGFPFGSLMPYALDGEGRPVFFISNLAMHTQNLRADPRASLFISEAAVSSDPLALGRLTVVGNVTEVPSAEIGEIYLQRHPDAEKWRGFPDFAYFRLEPVAMYYVGGFGVMGWLS